MDPDHGNGNSKHLEEHPVTASVEGDDLTLDRKSSSSSSSSSSTDSSLEEFQIDASELSKPASEPLKREDDIQLASEDDGKGAPSYYSPKSGGSEMGSPGAKESPPVQVMERSQGSDSYRIPSSVFERSKSTTPLDWSVASNESLFSIHVGNNSFSKDNVFLMGRSGELSKSGELTKSGDLTNYPCSPSMLAGTDNNTTVPGEDLGVTEAAAETMKEVLRESGKDHSEEKAPPAQEVPLNTNLSQRSDGSVTSIQSFAFPILTKEATKSVSPKEQQSQQQQTQSPQPPEETPAATQTRWFPCFACCPFCC